MTAVRSAADAEAVDVGGLHRAILHEAPDGSGLVQAFYRVDAGAVTDERSPGAGRIEVLFSVAGTGTLFCGGETYTLRSETAVFVAAGRRYRLSAEGERLEIMSVTAPASSDAATLGSARDDDEAARVVDLAAQVAHDAVSEREYRLLFGPHNGCAPVTQFVGYIPRIRTPLHYHDYSEMLYVLSGTGRVEIAGAASPVGPGSCFFLPAGRHHLVENLGSEHLRLLGVFAPAGSPDVAHPVEPHAVPAG